MHRLVSKDPGQHEGWSIDERKRLVVVSQIPSRTACLGSGLSLARETVCEW